MWLVMPNARTLNHAKKYIIRQRKFEIIDVSTQLALAINERLVNFAK
jgi:hypothetical protein